MQIINTPNINKARTEIQKLKKNNKKELIIVQAQDNEFNRKILENKDIDVLLSPESGDKKDFLKQRDSGLNEVLCKLASKNNIKIGIDLEQIKNKNAKQKAILLSRIMQNIHLCKRTKTKFIIFPETKKQDIQGFFQTLGSSTEVFKT